MSFGIKVEMSGFVFGLDGDYFGKMNENGCGSAWLLILKPRFIHQNFLPLP